MHPRAVKHYEYYTYMYNVIRLLPTHTVWWQFQVAAACVHGKHIRTNQTNKQSIGIDFISFLSYFLVVVVFVVISFSARFSFISIEYPKKNIFKIMNIIMIIWRNVIPSVYFHLALELIRGKDIPKQANEEDENRRVGEIARKKQQQQQNNKTHAMYCGFLHCSPVYRCWFSAIFSSLHFCLLYIYISVKIIAIHIWQRIK